MRKGQSIIEYALLVAIVAAAFAAMSVYARRAVNANLKMIEDRVNSQ
jgi:Flp pilus assembly pilin Flp